MFLLLLADIYFTGFFIVQIFYEWAISINFDLTHSLLARNTALVGVNPNAEGGICKPSRNCIVF
ncbi:hypothetical protein VF14_05330 [Nostoc linckia z18]|uniref:Uncharacterized protein n=1 Tax=Nostoc linckia z8 TaxID=1628746 RepID=A0A9Q5ZF61_NOSLI|nr:hypothetical protein VF02_04830 [Nostoc linckia z1]PHJ72539.1 hypothetical protein VF05_03790 [Nostoc linckia z3]PHJ74881.1 hypothetical protein VF03_12605 [Nostoc linckia z2]PHJ85038.1 hypothetical protein VF06_07665 [Nostoc linckia z4]PHJ91921.1 hypothetical protein VF07_03095 [Nostoc linckia z6]PHK06071.1 hypothetical protein VF08_05615 [Nostoc linckia z8]PHK12304.1 hypothetical protein VF09_04005 [Nostoc linckia z9]PHK21695.1 hypothetical protein VF10_17980 [Nostoc linckia z13]PHK222